MGETCDPIPLPAEVRANSSYTDAKHSVTDQKLLEENTRKLQAIRAARDTVERDIDAALRADDPHAASCAIERMRSWAESHALTQPVMSMQALYEQNRFVLTFALITLKAEHLVGRAALAPVRAWLSGLASAQVDAYRKFKGVRNNLYYWAGASAAAVDLLVDDRKLDIFVAEVWGHAMKAADSDGSFPEELERGQMSLTYQTYATDALIILKLLRDAKHAPLSDPEAWSRIVAFTIKGLCDPDAVASKVGGAQTAVYDKALVPVAVFSETAGASPLPACVPRPTRSVADDLGGDVALLKRVLQLRKG